ncbi:hypothetical protein [Streptomyces sp. RTd22]|uniref:hypothetical protein n=1 Tax=Streptomyces sp. RTd22 TaxID=1841249 RepID=UPI00099FBC74|nr:hypothetical protein [Streptomyces sp. RTd22]
MLSKLENPVRDAFEHLIADDVEAALNTLTPKGKQHALQAVRIRKIAPRRVGRTLSEQVLVRARQLQDEGEQADVARYLTERIFVDLMDREIAPAIRGTEPGRPLRWSAALLRLAVFSHMSASVEGAHLLLWAARQPWRTDVADPAALEAACEMAEAVVTEAEVLQQDPHHRRAPRLEGASAEQSIAGRGQSAQAATADAAALYAEAESAVAAGRDAVDRIRGALGDGCPPSDMDIAALAAVAPAFDAARRALHAVSGDGPLLCLADFAAAVEALSVERTRDAAIRTALTRLAAATCAPDSSIAEPLVGAKDKASALLAEQTWDIAQRDEAGILAQLIDVIQLAALPDAVTELLGAQRRVAQAAPTYSMLVLLADQVILPGPALTGGGTQPREAAPVASDPQPTATGAEEAGPAVQEETTREAGDEADREPLSEPVNDTAEAADGEAVSDSQGETPPEQIAAQPHGGMPPSKTGHAMSHSDTTVADGLTEQSTSAAEPPPQPTATQESVAQPWGLMPQQRSEPEPLMATVGSTLPMADNAAPAATPDLDTVMARLVRERRYGLAAHLSIAAERPAGEARALRLAGLATALRHRGDRACSAVVEDLFDSEADFGGEGAVHLLVLPALLRTALITGEHVVGAALKELPARLPDALGQMAGAVAQRTLEGALAMAPLSVVLADASGAEQRLREATDGCRDLLRVPHIRIHRATKLVERWLDGSGLLGAALHAIATGAAEADGQATALLQEIGRRSDIETAIDRLDAELRGTHAPLHGAGRNAVRQFAERVREGVRTWHLANREAVTARSAEQGWAVETASALCTRLLALGGTALDELAAEERQADPLAAAAAFTARGELSALLGELREGARVPWSAVTGDPRRVLDVELLKVGASHRDVSSLEDLLKVVDADWEQALTRQLGHDHFSAVRTVADLHAQGVLPGGEGFELSENRLDQMLKKEEVRKQELALRRVELTAEVGRVEAEDAVTPEQGIHLRELLADAAECTESGQPRELADIRRTLDLVDDLVPQYRHQATQELRKRLDALPGVGAEEREQVERALEYGNLGTAAELVYFLELGEKMPEMRLQESRFEGFFPEVPAALPDGLTPEVIEAVRTRGRHPGCAVLDYSGLSGEEAERTADALKRWTKLATTRQRHEINPREDLSPAVALLGYQARARRLDKMQRGRDYGFAELYEATVTGRAWAPAFGSQILDNGRKLRLLLVWGQPSASRLMDLVGLDPDESSLLVVHFGTMNTKVRADLAVAAQGARPLLVVDDAALAYLAAHGRRGVDAATEILLPFSSVNPYIKEKRGRIGWEMFYGRDTERKSILDSDGTQVLYGGRGLGKSALLADAGERFEKQRPGVYRKLYVNLDPLSMSRATSTGAEAIWPELERRLVGERILAEPRGKAAQGEPWRRVQDGIECWLREDPERRLLILLDECDGFFESDAVRQCSETRRLRALAELSDATRNRAKVVFAGLHSVQRFTRHVQNTPFNQMAQNPTVVGPLKPQFAADLLLYPMRALGYEFADTDLVNRVLGFCSYQPFLLQIFGHRLVRAMQGKRLRERKEPPYQIDENDIATVEQDPDLRAEITKAFQATLDLDDCYRVVADVLARHARDRGLQTRLSDRELREECETWWREGFHRLDSVSFRAYLEEMVGLGTLAPNHDGAGWHLRGPNALRMIGTADEIESRLLRAEEDCRLQDTVVLERRPRVLKGERSAPLTVNQIDYLRGDGSRNLVRVVLGSEATGIGDVAETLHLTTHQAPRWSPVGTCSAHDYRKELQRAVPDEHRLVVSDLRGARPVKVDRCRESLAEARVLLPPNGTRTVALVTGTNQLAFWHDLIAEADATVHDELVVLKRLDVHGVRAWAQDQGLFGTEQRLEMLAARTGGWPLLLDRAANEHAGCRDQDHALSHVDEWLNSVEGAERFVDATGLTDDEGLYDAYGVLLAEFGTEWSEREDHLAAFALADIEPGRAERLLACLRTLQVFDHDGGRWRLERVLARAWEVVV